MYVTRPRCIWLFLPRSIPLYFLVSVQIALQQYDKQWLYVHVYSRETAEGFPAKKTVSNLGGRLLRFQRDKVDWNCCVKAIEAKGTSLCCYLVHCRGRERERENTSEDRDARYVDVPRM